MTSYGDSLWVVWTVFREYTSALSLRVKEGLKGTPPFNLLNLSKAGLVIMVPKRYENSHKMYRVRTKR